MMKLNKQEKDNLICVGSIGKARGLKGEFFLNSFCSPKENILNYSNFIIENNEVSEFKIKYVKKANTKFISKINNIDDIENIKNLTNLKIFIKKEDLPKLTSGEVYWHELINMKVIDRDSDDILGIVKDLKNFGANDCLEVFSTDESIDNKNRLIPYVKDKIIHSIDSDKFIIYVNWNKDF